MLEGFRRDTAIRDIGRREGIRPSTYYAWLKDFVEAGKERLTRDITRGASTAEIQELKCDTRLKRLVADLCLDNAILNLGNRDNKWVLAGLCVFFSFFLLPYLTKEAFSDSFLLGLSLVWSALLAISVAYILRNPPLLLANVIKPFVC